MQIDNSKLQKLKIGKNASNISSQFNFKALNVQIELDTENKNYAIVNNVLYNYDKTKLICALYPITENLTIESTVKEISDYAFYGQEEIQGITLPNGIEKIGKEAVIEELEKIQVPTDSINKILEFIEIEGTTDEKLQKLQDLNIENEAFQTGLEELKQVVKYVRLFGIPDSNFKVDLTIARGLNYYTGTVYETFLNDYRELGSVCSGGRYENLAEYYTDKKLPGVGVSIGLTRLFYKLNEMNLIKASKKSISEVLIIPMVEDLTIPIKIANKLRTKGTNAEIYLNNKKLKAKFKYADKLKIPYVIVVGEDEIQSGKYTLKNMETGEEQKIEFENL